MNGEGLGLHRSSRLPSTTAARGALLVGAAITALFGLFAPTPGIAAGYTTHGTCAGFPRIDVHTAPGTCLALLADAGAGLRFPRRVLEVAPGRYWLVDMGSWEPGHGRLLEFMLPAAGAATPIAFAVLADRLDRPLGLVRGPDGRSTSAMPAASAGRANRGRSS